MNHDISEISVQRYLSRIKSLSEENRILREEICVSREASEITAALVVKQFEETEKILRRFQTANEQRKAVLNSASQFAIIATDINGIIIIFNTGAENLLGYSTDEVVGKQTPEIFHPNSELAFHSKKISPKYGCEIKGFDIFIEYAILGGCEQYEWTYVRKDGNRFPVSLSVNPLRDPGGTVNGFLSIATDISEKRRSELAIKKNEKKYRSLFISGPNPIFVIDRNTLEIYDANPMAEEVYGYTADELIGRPCTVLCTSKNSSGIPLCKRNVQTAGCMENWKIQHYKKGKKPFYVKVKACPTEYTGKEAIILAVSDLSEMMDKDAQLIQASKMTTMGEMSASIAHELNQPLAAIKLGSDFLCMSKEHGMKISESDLTKVAAEVSLQVDRASDIINRLRAFTRKPDFEKEIKQININNCIRNVLGIVGQQLKLQNIKTDLDLNENLPCILALDNLIDQVVFNLITNARDAVIYKKKAVGKAKEEHVIAIRSFLEKNHMATVTVSDTGIGIPDNIRDKIFEPFYTTKEVGEGMGLGLSVIYGIVRDLKGSVTVQSKEGKGSVFTISFPGYWEDIPL